MTYKTHTTCLICQSDRLIPKKNYEDAYLCQCLSCSFVFSQRIPTQKELKNHYEKYGRDDYLSPITINRYNELLDEFEKYRKTNKILDVGCGIGYFLEVAKQRGWEVYGTEYTDKAVEICEAKGINMNQGKLSIDNYEPESFDIITSFEVIEHINNPIEEIQNFYSLLRKGGLTYVTTPNFNSLLRYRLKEKYDVICYPEHLSYYTPKTIKYLFCSIGFSKKKIETTGISISRLKAGKGVTNEKPVSQVSTDEKIRNQLERKWYLRFLKRMINSMLTFFGVGDSLKAYFIKH